MESAESPFGFFYLVDCQSGIYLSLPWLCKFLHEFSPFEIKISIDTMVLTTICQTVRFVRCSAMSHCLFVNRFIYGVIYFANKIVSMLDGGFLVISLGHDLLAKLFIIHGFIE